MRKRGSKSQRSIHEEKENFRASFAQAVIDLAPSFSHKINYRISNCI